MLFREYWFQWGRLENYICVMGCHPEYLECFMKLQAHLFHADLPIPYPDRHYLAVLDRVYSLTHRGDSSSRETLSLSELMHAVAIMTHVHALTCFIFACGIVPEIDQNEEMFRQLDCIQTNGQCDAMLPSPPGIYPDGAVTPRNGLADGSNSIDTVNSFPTRRTSVIRNNDPIDHESSATQLLYLIQTEDSSWEEVSEDMVAEQFIEVTQLNIKLDAERSATELQRTAEFVNAIDQHPAIVNFVENPDTGYVNFQGKPFHVS
ncbi:hypothetical protein FBUS_01401, partial [Fasciolopsis buskii]